MEKQNADETSILATHRDPSLRRDRSLRQSVTARKGRVAGRGIEWITPTELAMRGASHLLGTVSMLGVAAQRNLRTQLGTTASPATGRAQRLASAASFGRSRRGAARQGIGL